MHFADDDVCSRERQLMHVEALVAVGLGYRQLVRRATKALQEGSYWLAAWSPYLSQRCGLLGSTEVSPPRRGSITLWGR